MRQGGSYYYRLEAESLRMATTNEQTVILAISIGGSVFLVMALLVCLACVIRCTLYRAGSTIAPVLVHNELDLDLYCPPLKYDLFLKYVGHGYQNDCVICLEELSALEQQGPDRRSSSEHPSQQQPISSPSAQAREVRVRLTVCGHLIHDKCLRQWFNREENCPLCREKLTLENMHQWEERLGFSFTRQREQAEGHRGARDKSFHNNETLESMENNGNLVLNEAEIREDHQVYALGVYYQIMLYHKRHTHNQSLRLSQHFIYSEQNADRPEGEGSDHPEFTTLSISKLNRKRKSLFLGSELEFHHVGN